MSKVQHDVRKEKRIRELLQEAKDIEAGTIVLDDNGEPEEPVYPSGPSKRKKTNIQAIKKEN